MAPREVPSEMQQEAALLEAFAEIPNIAAAWVLPLAEGAAQLTVQTTQRNIAANAQRRFITTQQITGASETAQPPCVSFPLELKDVLLFSPSPSGKRTLVVRGGSEASSAVLEVWGGGRVLKELHVPKGLHGGVYNDGWFGNGVAWSPAEDRIAYVAEAPAAKQTPKWGDSAGNPQNNSNTDGKSDSGSSGAEKPAAKESAAPKTWRGVGEWQEDWGELNTGKQPPTLFVLDLHSWRVEPVTGLPQDSSFGQPIWTPSGDALVFVAWSHVSPNFPSFPQRLGIVYCFNRPCALWAVPAPDTSSSASSKGAEEKQGVSEAELAAVRLTEEQLLSAFSPRFDPAGKTLAFLSQQAACASGVHNGTSSLHAFHWPHEEASGMAAARSLAGTAATELLPVVHQPESRDAFPGLYSLTLPQRPFSTAAGGVHILANTQWRSSTAIVSINTQSGAVTQLTPADGAAWTLLDHNQGWLVASSSSPAAPASLHVAMLPHSGDGGGANPSGPLSWAPVATADPVPFQPAVDSALQDIVVETLQLRPAHPQTGGDVPFEAIVVRPRGTDEPLPTILLPHGGPHSAYVAGYALPTGYLPALGYAVLAVNFRGSTGFGEACVQSLPGHAGSADVADCMQALQAAVDKSWVDPERVALVGGSHGGFLTAHLAGQHPDAFAAAVLRNPVCDLSVMVHVSDIPDWCYIEAWGTEEGQKRMAARPSAEDLRRFREVSPIAHVDSVKAPMLFMLGAKDRRVPMEDAKLYVRALKARGADAPDTQVIVLPEDTHALDRPQTEFEQWLNVAAWLKRHMASQESS